MRDDVARAGFTLQELIAVTAILGIVAAIAVPKIDGPERRADRATRELVYALMGAQQRSVLKQHDVLVDFDVPAGLVRVTEDRDMDGLADADEAASVFELPDGIRFELGRAPALAVGGGPVTFPASSDGLPRVVFHRSGSASMWGAAYISAATPGVLRAVEVNRATGRVGWYELGPSGWNRK